MTAARAPRRGLPAPGPGRGASPPARSGHRRGQRPVPVAPVLLVALLAGACAGPDSGSSGGGAGSGAAGDTDAPPEGVAAAGGDEGAPAIFFIDVAESAGIRFRHVAGDPREKRVIYEGNSGGLAWIDADSDGRFDLYLTNSGHRLLSTPPPPSRRTSPALFRNEGDGRFRDVTGAAGLTDWRWGMAAATGDFDNDGDTDLYVTHVGANALWRNNGDGTFTDVAAAAGVDDPGPGSGAAFGDVDRDGLLDLYVANYVQVDADRPLPSSDELCTYRGVAVYCGPKGLPAAPDRLYRNRGDGTFEDISETSGIAAAVPSHGFDVLFLDADTDGDADIYVAVDAAPSLLFVNDGSGRFEESAVFRGLALAEAGTAQAGMGLDAADWNRDGRPDVVKTNFESEIYNLYLGSPGGLFSDRSHHLGLGPTMPRLGWSALFLDIDRDGWLDLFFANGHVFPQVESDVLQLRYAQRNQVFLTRPGPGGAPRLIDVSDRAGPGLLARKVSRGAGAADYDGDGDLDLAVQNLDGRPDLLRNDTATAGSWLAVRTRGTRSNRDGYGARVTVRAGGVAQSREVRASRGFLSSSDPAAWFGLGEATAVDALEVAWPSGLRERFPVTEPARRVIVVEGEGETF